MNISELINRLANAHEFKFTPGEALWVAGSGKHGPLIIAVAEFGKRFIVARTYLYNEKPFTGFRVYYDAEWKPIAAVGDDGSVVKDIGKANQVMCDLIEKVYLATNEAWIRKSEYLP